MGVQPFSAKKRDELKKKVADLYTSGLTFREVSKALNISHETARKLWLSTQVKDVA